MSNRSVFPVLPILYLIFFLPLDIFIDNFNETIVDDQMDANDYIKHIISETNGADPTGAWKKYAEEEVFTPEQMKNGTFLSLIPGLIDVS